MYNNLFIDCDYVNRAVLKQINLHPGNIEPSLTILSLLTNLSYYEIKSQDLKNMAIPLDKI